MIIVNWRGQRRLKSLSKTDENRIILILDLPDRIIRLYEIFFHVVINR